MIAKKINCTPEQVRYFLIKYGVLPKRHNAINYNLQNNPLLNKDWLYEQYVNQLKSSHDIAKEIGCIHVSIINYLKRFNIPVRTNNECFGLRGKTSKSYPLLNNKDWLYEQYINQKKTTREIGKIIGCSRTSVSGYLESYGIERR